MRYLSILLSIAALVPGTVIAGQLPEPGEIVDKAIAAVGGDGLAKLEVLRLAVSEDKTQNDGQASSNNYTAYVDMAGLKSMRLELAGGVVLGRTGDDAWATNQGVFDERPQTPYMAGGTLNQTLFPILLPYSLKMDGVWVKEVGEIEWEGRPAWTLLIPFVKGFFVSPVLTTTWRIVVAKDDYSILGVDFLPPVDLRDVQFMGIRYRILKYDDIEGARIPSQVLAIGINFEGYESGATRITRIQPTAYGPWEAGLFVSPVRLEALEGE